MQAAFGFDPYLILQVQPTADPEVIQAAFRALARKYHPDRDQSQHAAERMTAVNRAYAMLRDGAGRAAHDRERRATDGSRPFSSPVAPAGSAARPTTGGVSARTRQDPTSSVLDFGRYRGWSLQELARHDIEYLLWLSRHSSGIRFRTEIYNILRTVGVSAA